MSEPIRYTFEAKEVLDANGMVCFVGVSTLTHPMGKYVAYEDYARLKAEVENSKRINTELLALSNRQASDIRRLTKAGDNLARVCRGIYGGLPLWEEWNAAKGVQS